MSTATLFRIPVYRSPAAPARAPRERTVPQAGPSFFGRWLTRLAAWGESATHHRLGSWTQH